MKDNQSDRFFMLVAVLLTVVVILGIVWAYQRGSKPTVTATNYSSADAERPVAQLDRIQQDLGSMSLAETREVEFVITNAGQKPLELYDVKTSCDCTKASVTINDEPSPTFSMHNNSSWLGEVKPGGGQAKVKVTYIPKIHPVEGLVERVVQISTNDPDQPNLQLTVNADVYK